MKKLIFFLCIVLSAYSLYSQEVKLPEKPINRTSYSDYFVKESGYWTAIEATLGTTARFNRKNFQPVSLAWINGYRFNEFLKLGVGAGVKYFIGNDKIRKSTIPWAFPLYVDARGNFISQQDREIVPFWSVDAGAEIRGGVYFSPTIGYRFGSSRGSFLLGLNYQMCTYDTWYKKNELITCISLKLGYEF